jgi:hypothetical protein
VARKFKLASLLLLKNQRNSKRTVNQSNIRSQTMITQTKTNQDIETPVDVLYETSQFAMGVGMVSASLIAVWAMLCMASAISSNGLPGVIKSFFSAVTGS